MTELPEDLTGAWMPDPPIGCMLPEAPTPDQGVSGAPQGGPEGCDVRQAAYDAVYAYIGALGDTMPPDPVHRNAIIWRAVTAALDATPDPYRLLLDHLREERTRALRNAPHASLDEARLVNEGIAAGIRIAEAWAITLFEGHDARMRYLTAEGVEVGPALAGTVDKLAASEPPAHDAGPTVAEAKADDRAWPLQKTGE